MNHVQGGKGKTFGGAIRICPELVKGIFLFIRGGGGDSINGYDDIILVFSHRAGGGIEDGHVGLAAGQNKRFDIIKPEQALQLPAGKLVETESIRFFE